MDVSAALEDGIRTGLQEVAPFLKEQAAGRDAGEFVELGRQAVHLALASLRWEDRLGPTWTTSEATKHLGMSRQAIAKATAAGRLVALPAGKTRRFPTWQFEQIAEEVLDATGGPLTHDEWAIRPEVVEITRTWRRLYPDVTDFQIAAWARTRQPELRDVSPAAWLATTADLAPVLFAAAQAATALVQ